jgi:isopenicillin-N epimerase
LLRNTTEGVGTVLLNWPLSRGEEILTSSAEHGPYYDLLNYRAARDGVVIKRFHYPAPAPTPDAIVNAVDAALTPRTRLECAGLVAWEPDAALRPRLQEALRARQIIWGGTEPYAGFFGIPEDAPRSLPIFNVGVFTSVADVDKVAEAFEAAAAAR